MFGMRNKKIVFSYALLSGGLIGACGLIRLNMVATSEGSGVGGSGQ